MRVMSASLLPSVAAVLAAVAALPAQAETLKEVYAIARSYDATYLAARAQAESVGYKAAQADSAFLPTVGLTGSVSHNVSDTPVGGVRKVETAMVGINASQPLLNRGNWLNADKASKSLEIAQADLDTAEQDLIVRTAQAYFDVLSAQEVVNTAQAAKKAISEQLASAKRNFEVGTATITDTREAQARFDLSTAQLLGAENDLRTKQLALDQLVGRSGVKPQPLAQPVALPTLAEGQADDWATKAEQAAPVRKARTAYDIAKLETSRTEAGHWPTLSLDGSLSSTNNRGNTPTAAQLQGGDGTSTNAKIGLTLNVPLYAGGAISNQAREAVKLEEKARDDYEGARRAVAQGTRQAYFGVQSGQAQIQALEAAESSSKLALEATQLGYKVGVRVNLDVLNAQTQLYSTQRDLAKARHDVLVASLKLRQASGTLAPADVDNVDKLIAR
jgi:outer membrane protein